MSEAEQCLNSCIETLDTYLSCFSNGACDWELSVAKEIVNCQELMNKENRLTQQKLQERVKKQQEISESYKQLSSKPKIEMFQSMLKDLKQKQHDLSSEIQRVDNEIRFFVFEKQKILFNFESQQSSILKETKIKISEIQSTMKALTFNIYIYAYIFISYVLIFCTYYNYTILRDRLNLYGHMINIEWAEDNDERVEGFVFLEDGSKLTRFTFDRNLVSEADICHFLWEFISGSSTSTTIVSGLFPVIHDTTENHSHACDDQFLTVKKPFCYFLRAVSAYAILLGN
ncbi:hypothetical protein RFI_19220 [Reticulomyxa filosa]|uniref:Kinetochore protein SPC25 n=1 Tax=Reticulomyxa filosa TaxID=46433 RepID=X6MYB4_RETFI|nr:hypothetical protein RFI_19220 [Reticulomyxa filosa]|eukprot:ETO18070.1 hypothetical protein RFI_19220 [Reticulomyxa filosa]